ncbi:MAG: hypothetical protein WCO02_07140 [Bacteroidota bacterium]
MKKILLMFLVFILLAGSLMFIPVIRRIVFSRWSSAGSVQSYSYTGENLKGGSSGEGSATVEKKAPEPTIERIKTDLIGREIPGWKFDKVSEFVNASITSVARTDIRIDYRLELRMLPFNTKEDTYYDAQIFTTYLMGDEDWYLDKVEEIFLSFEVKIPPGRWINIGGVAKCDLQPDPKNRLVWTSKSWDYEVSSGPNISDLTLPPALSYQVKSKSKHPVTVKLKFIPEL